MSKPGTQKGGGVRPPHDLEQYSPSLKRAYAMILELGAEERQEGRSFGELQRRSIAALHKALDLLEDPDADEAQIKRAKLLLAASEIVSRMETSRLLGKGGQR